MALRDIFKVLQGALNMAHIEDRRAESLLAREEPDIQSAIECHQRAHGHLRSAQLNISPQDILPSSQVDEAFYTSLYSQMEYHVRQQSVLLNKQRRIIIELKRKSYIASIREKTVELAVNNALNRQNKLQEQLSQQKSLLESLKDKLADSDSEDTTTISDPTTIQGKKKPKNTTDTLEELQSLVEQFKELVSELTDENIRLKSELKEQKKKDSNENHKTAQVTTTTPQIHINRLDIPVDNAIYPFPRALNITPLEKPPDFNLEDLKDSSEDFSQLPDNSKDNTKPCA